MLRILASWLVVRTSDWVSRWDCCGRHSKYKFDCALHHLFKEKVKSNEHATCRYRKKRNFVSLLSDSYVILVLDYFLFAYWQLHETSLKFLLCSFIVLSFHLFSSCGLFHFCKWELSSMIWHDFVYCLCNECCLAFSYETKSLFKLIFLL